MRIVNADQQSDSPMSLQIAPCKKVLANRKTQGDHNAATGRRFTL
jgi:hypothetical protein